MKFKNYLLYGLGEILLVVIGILLAMQINNWNTNRQYEKKIDNNIIRVYGELEKNIDRTRKVIIAIQQKDSIINLVMNDDLKFEDYTKNLDLALIIVNNHSSGLFDEAFQNLVQLNNSDNLYNDDLLTKIKEIYKIANSVKRNNATMTDFITHTSIPFLTENLDSFSDLIFGNYLQDDAINYFLNSKEYKKYVSSYILIAIRNQLVADQVFYAKAVDLYHEIGKIYNLDLDKDIDLSDFSKYKGLYYSDLAKDTIEIRFENDSLFLMRKALNLNLIPFSKNHFFIDRVQKRSSGEFCTFRQNKDQTDWELNAKLLSLNLVYEKINE